MPDVDEQTTLPLAEERLTTATRAVETGRVRVRVVTREEPVLFREELRSEAVEIERVPIGREIETAPEIRHDGEFTILPVIEERLVVEKRLFLTEEIRIRRRARVERIEEEIMLRRQHADVERIASSGDVPLTE